ncbi:MAG: hypothetical protein AB7H88_04095 [Vicinamibacterales bacterium]
MTAATPAVDGAPPAASQPAPRFTVMLVLPRADHLRAYQPLVRALGRAGDVAAIVVSAGGTAPGGPPVQGAAYEPCPFDGGDGGTLGWLRLLVRRERTARRLVDGLRGPAVLAVPSDVSDLTLPFVARARRRGVPVAYVQGAFVFADYPRLNAATQAAEIRSRPLVARLGIRVLPLLLRACGVHAAILTKGVIGSQADRSLLIDEGQLEVHEAAGVPAARLRVTGAPFLDDLFTARDRFDDVARRRVLAGLGLDDRPMAVFISKTRHRIGADPSLHETIVRDVVGAIRAQLPGWACVVKLHPNEDEADYQWLIDEADPLVRVVKRVVVEDLLLAGQLTLSLGTSSPAFTATLLGRPLILVNFTGASILDAHGGFVAAATSARSAAELGHLLGQVAREGRAALARLTMPPAVEAAWFDGRASERIVGHLRELADGQAAETT